MLNGKKGGRSKSGVDRKYAPTRDSYTRKVLGDGSSATKVKAGKSKSDPFTKYKHLSPN